MKRKRINNNINKMEVVDPMKFKVNCASKNAQCIHKYDELKVELWCDKHYHQRRTFGDANGERKGIEVGDVQNLIIKAFKYLLDIHLRGVQFKFINYFDPSNPKKKLNRIVLKEVKEGGVLNVVAEIHYLDTSKFELTVITAMKVDDFNVTDGQYALSILNKQVVLRRKVLNSLNDVYKIDL